MSDNQLLMLAADAIGLVYDPAITSSLSDGIWIACENDPKYFSLWNPLENDGEILSILVNFRLKVSWPESEKSVLVCDESSHGNGVISAKMHFNCTGDPKAALRRAVVQVVAAIAKAKGGAA